MIKVSQNICSLHVKLRHAIKTSAWVLALNHLCFHVYLSVWMQDSRCWLLCFWWHPVYTLWSQGHSYIDSLFWSWPRKKRWINRSPLKIRLLWRWPYHTGFILWWRCSVLMEAEMFELSIILSTFRLFFFHPRWLKGVCQASQHTWTNWDILNISTKVSYLHCVEHWGTVLL